MQASNTGRQLADHLGESVHRRADHEVRKVIERYRRAVAWAKDEAMANLNMLQREGDAFDSAVRGDEKVIEQMVSKRAEEITASIVREHADRQAV